MKTWYNSHRDIWPHVPGHWYTCRLIVVDFSLDLMNPMLYRRDRAIPHLPRRERGDGDVSPCCPFVALRNMQRRDHNRRTLYNDTEQRPVFGTRCTHTALVVMIDRSCLDCGVCGASTLSRISLVVESYWIVSIKVGNLLDGFSKIHQFLERILLELVYRERSKLYFISICSIRFRSRKWDTGVLG